MYLFAAVAHVPIFEVRDKSERLDFLHMASPLFWASLDCECSTSAICRARATVWQVGQIAILELSTASSIQPAAFAHASTFSAKKASLIASSFWGIQTTP